MLTTAHLINRTTMPLLSHHTPYSILHGKDDDYSLIRTFGCLTYASTLAARRTKFDPRATPCFFMGYTVGVKGYKLYDIQKKQFFISRDVLFFEHLFPFASISTHEGPTNDFFDNMVLPYVYNSMLLLLLLIPQILLVNHSPLLMISLEIFNNANCCYRL